MVSDGKNFNMSLLVSMGYCIEVVGKEGQGEPKVVEIDFYLREIVYFLSRTL